MSHLIDMSNRRANMAYVGKTPWHGLGQELSEDTTIEQWVVEAGLNWTIKSAPVTFTAEDGTVGNLGGSRVLYRSDTKAALASVSNTRFHVRQPNEMLEFYRDLVEEDGLFQVETAGSLDGGKMVWAMARYKTALNISGDIIKPYLLLTDACTGKRATTAQFTTVRVVCNNTLQMSLNRDSASSIAVNHSVRFDAFSVKQQLGLVDSAMEDFATQMDRLASIGMNDTKAAEFFTGLYVKTDEKGNVTNEKWLQKTVVECLNLFHNGPGAELKTAKGSAWGALNVVTHFEDFKRKALNDDSRFRSAQFGEGARIKSKAVELLAA